MKPVRPGIPCGPGRPTGSKNKDKGGQGDKPKKGETGKTDKAKADKDKPDNWRPTLVQYNELLKKYDAKAAGAQYYDRY